MTISLYSRVFICILFFALFEYYIYERQNSQRDVKFLKPKYRLKSRKVDFVDNPMPNNTKQEKTKQNTSKITFTNSSTCQSLERSKWLIIQCLISPLSFNSTIYFSLSFELVYRYFFIMIHSQFLLLIQLIFQLVF